MGGRALLFLVVGFSMIFLVLGKNFGGISTEAITNMSNYYSQTMAHNIAESGANLAANQMFLNGTWSSGYQNLQLFNAGKSSLNVTVDTLDKFKNIKVITATGTYQGVTAVVKVTLQPSHFSKYAYFSNDENGVWWATGDTVFGPFHTNDYMQVDGHPVFLGPETSTLKGIKKANSQSSPIIQGSFSTGDSMAIPPNGISNLDSLAKLDGYVFTGMDSVYLDFKGDSITYTTFHDTTITTSGGGGGWGGRGGWGSRTTTSTIKLVKTVPSATFSQNGVIFAENALLRVKGVVKGQFTVGSSSNSSYNTLDGSIYIDSSIVYNTDPRTDPNCEDLLGIAAQNYVYISDNSANRNGINIDAAIYAQNYGFGAQNYSTRPYSGSINLYGGITQNIREPVGIIGYSGTITNGFNKSYFYDTRLLVNVPPEYPSTGGYQILSWYE